MGFFGIGISATVYRAGTYPSMLVRQFMTEAFTNGFGNLQGLSYDFGTDTVARQYGDFQFHNKIF